MSAIDGGCPLFQFGRNGRFQGFGNDAGQQGKSLVQLAPRRVITRFRVIETRMDGPGQGLVALPVRRCILSQESGNLLQVQIHLAKGAVVYEVYGFRVLDEVPAAVGKVRPALKEAVHRIAVHVLQPALHLGIETLEWTGIGIGLEGAPGGLHEETAPVGASAGGIRIRGGVGKAAVLTGGVGPGLQPVQVQRGHVGKGLERQGGGVAVSAIAQSLDAGTVYHIAVKGKILHGPGHQVVNPVQVLVRAGEPAREGIVGPHA